MNSNFHEKIWKFYAQNKRDFPWRETTNPYHILVSEVMLQQTQTSRVLPKYQEFLKKFPTLESLAKASNADVLGVWSGLGYNRRGLYIKHIAESVVKNHQGKIPLDPKTLITFPGIGPNTAGSIYVFTTNKPYVFIETNIRRVFIHEFFKDQKVVSDKEILKLIKKSLPAGRQAREWYFALMDYGVFLAKTEVNPNKKSKHYSKQSKFKGSLRQVRGEILRILLKETSINKSLLMKKIKSQHFEPALIQLYEEKFLQIDHENNIKIS